jgi:hypothetical protein
MVTEIKIRASIVKKYIKKFSKQIQHMDGKHLPEVMLELQAEEAELQDVPDYKSITTFSKETLEQVFHCWFGVGEGEEWFNVMVAEELALQANKNTPELVQS